MSRFKQLLLPFLFLLSASLLLTFCKKKEEESPEPNDTSGEAAGRLVFYSTADVFNNCGSITIEIDGQVAGELSSKAGSTPSCSGITTASALVFVANDVGVYHYEASDKLCSTFQSGDIVLNNGDCKNKEIIR